MKAPQRPARRGPAGGLGGFVLAEVVAALVLGAVMGWSWQILVESFVLTNALMGLTFGLCGAVIAWHRPANPIGWLFIADGIGHATTAVTTPIGQLLADGDAPMVAQRLVATVSMAAWPWSIGLFLPLALLLFPTGRLLSPRWRWAAIGIVVTSPLFVLEMTGEGSAPGQNVPPGYLSISSYDELAPLWTITELRNLVALLLAITCLTIRYRRADEMGRRQLLWLLLASVIAFLFVTPWSFIAGTPILVLLAIPLIPVAVAVAIVRYQLLDIRLVVSRALTWALLSLVAIGAYAALAAILGSLISSQVGRSAAITVLVALIIAPILPRLQRLVDRALYGDRGDPARVASRVGAQLSAGHGPEGPGGGLPGVVAAIRSALRFPYVALIVDNTIVAADGTPPARVVPLTLEYGGSAVGSLDIGLRSGESGLSSADRGVIGLVAVPLAVAVHATRLSSEVQSSREKLVSAREEERRRLRRDLHDGLGPTLTGVAFTADAAANVVDTDSDQARDLLSTLRSDTRMAIADVRRLVDDLRPPALDELGLVGALRQRADQLSFRADGASVQVEVSADGLPALPAALEVAAYRIATEALTNIVRHSHATSAVLALRCGDDLEVEVTDDGPPNGEWRPGVGLHAMRERAAELGGRFEAGPSPSGGVVRATFPLEGR
ncbi:two-component sensor histidine kinase [Kribbella turkmenica]|uniref:histidine kinase n=1 Tax=Kribbella turkmenica TaxID=2530375 RepID=A0A4R4WEH9_9ACTN|nr:histidine kinase [Kribbella turkmenica]TDD14663.1 two-component sensor histidine kinase [Kribbella turkmenica]